VEETNSMKNKLILAAAVAATALTSQTALAGKADDTLNWSTTREVDVALPYYNNVREMVILARHTWDNLLYRNTKTFEYEPALATSYKWVDSKTLEFKIRSGVKFHDGSDFSADDVVDTYNHVSRKDSGVLTRQNVSWIDRAEKIGTDTVRVHLTKTFPAALEFVAGPMAIFPSEIWATARNNAKGTKDYGTVAPIGTGPYITTKVVSGERIEMKKNPNYWNGSPKGQPSIGNIVFRTVADPEAQIAELLSGSLDWIWDVPKDKAEQLKLIGIAKVVSAPTMRVSYLAMDRAGRSGTGKDNPWLNAKVREAVAHAIDRGAIVKNLVGGAAEVVHSNCYPSQVGCAQDVPKYDYNPGKAKKLLAEAGFPNGFSTDIYAYRERPVTEAIMGYLAKVGIKTNLKYMQYKALRGIAWDGKAAFHNMTWGSYSMNDVSAITSHFFKGGRDDYCRDKEIIDNLEKGDTNTDPAVRKTAYKAALTKLAKELCWLPLFSYSKYYAYTHDLDFTPTADEIPRFFTAKWK
jgi:peptide/nickel transport system substrate-binding protein